MADAVVTVADVKAFKTQSGNTRFVLRDDGGREYTTFREQTGRAAVGAEGRKARIRFHEQQRGNFTNVYLDAVEPLEEPGEAGGGPSRGGGGGGWETAGRARPWVTRWGGGPGRRPPTPPLGYSAVSRRKRSRRRSCSSACSRSRSASPTTSAGSPRTSPTTRGRLRAGRDRAAAPLGGLAAPARDRVARGGDATEPGEQSEREDVEGGNPDPVQHLPSVARAPLRAYEGAPRRVGS